MSVIGDINVVGWNSGGTVSEYRTWPQGKVISKIRVWVVQERMKALRIWMTGETENQGQQFGNPDEGSIYDYTFQPGERIDSMSLWAGNWNNNKGNRFGCIMFTTTTGGSFNHGYRSGSEQVIDVYSGILVGAEVRAGADLNALGFAFLKPLIRCQLQNVTYVDLSGFGGIVLEVLDSLQSTNTSTVDINWSLQGSKTKTVSSSWSQTAAVTITIGVTVKAGVPEIADFEEKLEWQVSNTQTQQASSSTEHQLTWSQSGTLRPNQSIDIKAMTYSGSISVPYSGTMVVTVDSGESYSFVQKGMYDGVSVTAVKIVAS